MSTSGARSPFAGTSKRTGLMFESIKRLIADLGEDSGKAERFADDDYRVAAAALLVHAATIDGSVAELERQQLRSVIKLRFDLDDDAADELIAKATTAEQQAVDLYQFTARLNRSLDQAGRARVVEMMWQIVCADGTITEFEDNLIWRAGDLLGISRGERIALRERVKRNAPITGKLDE
jgi:uncharacterized tellurite resistance protein B-like protein